MNSRNLTKNAFFMAALIASTAISTFAQDGPLGVFEGETDIGAPALAGSCRYDAASQEYTIVGGGTNIWATGDQFHFVWKKVKGDFLLRARARFSESGGEPHRKIGWMIRASLDPDAPYADAVVHGNGHAALQCRRAPGAATSEILLPVSAPDVLQLERHGSNIVFSAAAYGDLLVNTNLTDLNLGDEVYIGLFVCPHTANATTTAVFKDVRLVRPVKDGFTPYRDYIGSVLEILEPHTGKLQVIHRSTEPFEAPNWTRDGASLIYNVSGSGTNRGRLRLYDLATGAITPLNTGSANRCNNDHVLTFDGTTLAISDQSAGGGSSVYVVPAAGGDPRRLTTLTPSYAHGWSPDAKFIVYTGGRSNKFDIYKMAAAGGEEIRLTDSPGLNDGPEYTPDGKYIYFNSTRTGRMQLWRMNPDGSRQQQVTDDQFNNWFPHISPDGKWIAFISFPADVKPTDHPYYKHCYLRLMPIEGGAPKVIAYLYGGQGTMNVPSWSPDSQKLAFVSNTGDFGE